MSNTVFRIVSLACWGVAVIGLAFGMQVGVQHLLGNTPNIAVGVKAIVCYVIMVMAAVVYLCEVGFMNLRRWLKMSWGWRIAETLFDGGFVMSTAFLAALCGTIMSAGYQYLPWWGATVIVLVTMAIGLWLWHFTTKSIMAPSAEEHAILGGTFAVVALVFTTANAATFAGGCFGIVAMAGIFVLLEMRKTAGAKTVAT